MRKRLVYRCDDVGYTEAFDMGAFKVLDEGIGTAADVMFDNRHAREALLMLKERPWISVGWHRHLWGRPVAGPENVPSMVNEEGNFKWRKDPKLITIATYEDAYREFEAELAFVKETLGRYPDTVQPLPDSDIPLEKAFYDICVKYDLNRFFVPEGGTLEEPKIPVDEKWKHLNFHLWYEAYNHHGIEKHKRFDLACFHEDNTLEKLMKIEWKQDGEVIRCGGHPGYLDDIILKESTCNIHRVNDVCIATSPVLKQWIIDNHIELVCQTDVLYGENKYQDHLRDINSPLWIGNM